MLKRILDFTFSITEALALSKTVLDHPGRLSDLDLPMGNTPYYVTSTGMLVSTIKIEGAMRYVLREGHGEIVDNVTRLINVFMRDNATHIAWMHLHQDEVASNIDVVRRCLAPIYSVSEANGYNNGIFLKEIEDMLSKSIQKEETVLCVWSAPNGETRADNPVGKIAGPGVQNADKVNQYERLSSSHAAKIDAIKDGLREAGLTVRVMTNTEMGAGLAQNLDVDCNNFFSPRLFGHVEGKNAAGETVKKRATLSSPVNFGRALQGRDYTVVMPPRIGFQIWQREPSYENGAVVLGDRAYSSLVIKLPPDSHVPFNMLIAMLKEYGVPFRVSQYNLSNSRIKIMAKMVLAGFLKKIGSNRILHQSLGQLRALLKVNRQLLMFQMTVTVWAPKDEPKLLQSRVETTIKAINRWGGAQAQKLGSDSLLGMLSTLPPFRSKSVAPAAIGPSEEILYLTPMFRASLPYSEGAVLFHSLDGKPMPFAPLSNQLTHHVYLICGEPGYGKSMLAQILLGAIAESFDVLPYIAISDVGPGSLGTIRYLQAILPSNLKKAVMYAEMSNDKSSAINRFDTPLGLRYPLPDEMVSMREWLGLAVSEAVGPNETSQKGMDALLSDALRIAYDRCADEGPRSEPKRYQGLCENDPLWAREVRPALNRLEYEISESTYYWDIVDALFDAKQYKAATLAQRFAIPLLEDVISACNSDDVRSGHKIEVSGGFTIVDYVYQRLTSFRTDFLVTQSVTQFDLSETRISAFNLESVVVDSDTPSAKRISSLYFGLTVEMQVSPFFWSKAELKQVPSKYRPYHHARLESIMRSKNMYFADEQQFFTGIAAAEKIPNSIATRGRKRGIGVMLATQLPKNFTDVMRELATVRFYCGFDSTSLKSVRDVMPIDDSEDWLLRNRVRGPSKKGANVLIQVSHPDGQYSQLVTLRVGVRKLWSLSTKNESSHLREALIAEFNYEQALEILAVVYPSGEVESEYERIVLQMQNPTSDDGLESLQKIVPMTDILQHMIDTTIETGKTLYSEQIKRDADELKSH